MTTKINKKQQSGVYTDGVTMTGDGSFGSPLVSVGGGGGGGGGVSIIQTFTALHHDWGDATSQFNITNPVGTTFRYTYDGTGTDPLITALTFPVGTQVIINGYVGFGAWNALNTGYFTVTGSGTDYFEINNGSGVVESNKVIGSNGYLRSITPQVYTKPAGLNYITVETVGGGAAGVSGVGGGPPPLYGLGGGGAGGYSKKIISNSLLGATETLVVGLGGDNNPNVLNSVIGNGTVSNFGSFITAYGGGIGSTQTGGSGGGATGGDLNIVGGSGSYGDNNGGSKGSGGSSILGLGGTGSTNGGLYGGGGGGGWGNDLGANGGLGADGIVVITEYFGGGSGGIVQPFTYGETVGVNDYVFQADENTSIPMIHPFDTAWGAFQISVNTTFVGDLFTFSDIRVTEIRKAGFIIQGDNGGFLTGNLFAEIYATSGGLPTGIALATSTSVNPDGLNWPSGALTLFDFPTPFIPTPGTQYALVLNTSGVTFSGGRIIYVRTFTGPTLLPTFKSTDGGATWSSPGGATGSEIIGSLTTGDVFKVDITTPLLDMGPYKGFALESGNLGDVKNVQLNGIVSGFTLLNPGDNLFINQTIPGGVTQSGTGRSIGVAVSNTEVQMGEMKKKSGGITYAGGNINQDGFLTVVCQSTGGFSSHFYVTETNTLESTIVFDSGNLLSNGAATANIPVRAGYDYIYSGSNFSILSALFYPLING